MKNNLPPVHPGKYIREALSDMAFSQAEIARVLGISPQYLNDIIRGDKGLTPEMCFKLPEVMGSTPDFWAELQKVYDLKIAESDKKVAEAAKAVRKRFTVLMNFIEAKNINRAPIRTMANPRLSDGAIIHARAASKRRSKHKERA